MLEAVLNEPRSQKLFIRLSSLGDVVLATSALEALPPGEKVDWVVSSPYEILLKGHPRIRRIWSFDRRSGRKGWAKLAELLWASGYDDVFDLHGSLRSRGLRFQFLIWRLSKFDSLRSPCWRVIRKPRVRRAGYFVFKRAWPRAWRPPLSTGLAARLVGGTGAERPNLRFLVDGVSNPVFNDPSKVFPVGYLCVMPSSIWEGKRWPVSKFLESLIGLGLPVVVLGSAEDSGSLELVEQLSKTDLQVKSGVGLWNLPEVASVLSNSLGYFGNDTGIAHLAEAVGTRAWMIFGPTRADTGFGPWRSGSLALESPLWCSPCSKDGRGCFRFNNRFACLKVLSSESVVSQVQKNLARVGKKR